MADYVYTTELYHYGVKGMKWGVRRTLDAKKASYKKAKKEYNKAFNTAYNKNHPYSLSKKRREATAERWADAHDKAVKLKTAKTEYKDAKKAYKAQKKAEKQSNKPKNTKEKTAAFARKGAKIASGILTASVLDDVFYGGAGKRVAKKAVIKSGRAVVTAYAKARGATSVTWYN